MLQITPMNGEKIIAIANLSLPGELIYVINSFIFNCKYRSKTLRRQKNLMSTLKTMKRCSTVYTNPIVGVTLTHWSLHFDWSKELTQFQNIHCHRCGEYAHRTLGLNLRRSLCKCGGTLGTDVRRLIRYRIGEAYAA